jgi:AcrR family transcriptional regulator
VTHDKKTDLRVRRTRANLQRAFLELMYEKGFQAVTVQDIADRAMVNRATFYDHFVDKYALMEYTFHEEFKSALAKKSPETLTYSDENLSLLILTVCEFMGNTYEHCSQTDKQLVLVFEVQLITLLKEILMGWFKEPTRELSITIASWAIYGAVQHWLESDPRVETDKLIHQALPLIRGIITGTPVNS